MPDWRYWKLGKKLDEVAQENRILRWENAKLRETRLRISIPTALGVRPVYDCPIEFAILQSLLAGGNGLTSMGPGEWIHGPVSVELISQWRPHESTDDSD